MHKYFVNTYFDDHDDGTKITFTALLPFQKFQQSKVHDLYNSTTVNR